VISRIARRALVLVTVAAAVGCVPALAGAAEPVGWRPVFSEAFDPPASGCAASVGPSTASYDLPDEVTYSEGLLRLHLSRRVHGRFTYTSGSVLCSAATQQYGRYEFRARAAGGPGVASFVTLKAATAGDDSRLDLVTTATGVRADLHNGYGAGVTERSGEATGTDYHTYILEWAPSGFRVYVDGQQRLVDAHVSTVRRTVGFGVYPADGMPTPNTVLPAEFAVDYLRVWAYDPSTSPAPSASTVEAAQAPAGVPPTSDRHLSAWLLGTAVTALLIAGLALGVWHTRPRRPRPGHRA
jgi:beta-glucanase (GH16 family)